MTELKSEVSRELNLKTVGRPFQPSASGLVVNDEEIAVGSIDVTQPHIDKRKTRGGV